MRIDIRFVLFLFALALLTACPPPGMGPAKPAPPSADCFTRIAIKGREPAEVKAWDGQVPNFSGRRIGWAMTQLQGHWLVSAIDLDKKAVAYAVVVPEEKAGELENAIGIDDVLLVKIGIAAWSGTRPPPGNPPVPQGEDLIRLIERQMNQVLGADFGGRDLAAQPGRPAVEIPPQ